MDAARYADYRQTVLARLLAYRQRHFAGRDSLFETRPGGQGVFRPEAAHLNYFDPALYYALTHRRRAFRSLGSSRVLAISIFGTLARREDLALLGGVPCDDGRPILPAGAVPFPLELQQPVPGAPGRRRGVIDIWLHGGDYGLAVHARFVERELGAGALAGTLAMLRALLPTLPGRGHGAALLVYDARNPAFAAGGHAGRELASLRHGIEPPLELRCTTWQALATGMARSPWYADLLEYLRAKYGVEADT